LEKSLKNNLLSVSKTINGEKNDWKILFWMCKL
jgi:hypothetical protein